MIMVLPKFVGRRVVGSLYRATKKYYINEGSPDFRGMVVFMEGVYSCIGVNSSVLCTLFPHMYVYKLIAWVYKLTSRYSKLVHGSLLI